MRSKEKILKALQKNERNPLCRFLYNYYEVLSYLFFGVLTTAVNFIVYTILETFLGQGRWYLSNLPAIVLAILFAFLTNREFVFESDGDFWSEMLKFFAARFLVSLVFEYGVIYLLYDVLHFDARLNLFFFSISWFKIISTFFVLFANYLASKIFVFKVDDPRKKGSDLTEENEV